METEIWPNFIREASHADARLAVINGRISERSFKRYSYIKPSIRRVLGYLDLALMQTNADASRIMAMGLRASKVRVTGNLKFDHSVEAFFGFHYCRIELFCVDCLAARRPLGRIRGFQRLILGGVRDNGFRSWRVRSV
jgi:hypothetical protein